MSDPTEQDQRRAVAELGATVALLLYESAWMHRRKVSVELLSDTWVRLKTSVDISIPAEVDPISPERDGQPALYAVPVTLLPKVPPSLMRFDFASGDQRLTLPTRRQNGLASFAGLLWACERVLGKSPLPARLREELLFIALAPPDYAAEVSWRVRAPGSGGTPVIPSLEELPSLALAETELQGWVAQMRGERLMPTDADAGAPALTGGELHALHVKLIKDPMVGWLLRKLATASAVVAHLPKSPTGRQTVHLAYDENIFKKQDSDAVGTDFVARYGWVAYPFVAEVPFVGASSFHFEFIAPAGLEAIGSALDEQSPEAYDEDMPVARSLATLSFAHGKEAGQGDAEDANDDAPVGADTPPADPGHLHENDAFTNGKPVRRAAPDLADEEYESGRPDYDFTPTRGDRVHLYWSDAGKADSLTAQVNLRVARETFVGAAAWSATAVAVSLTICAVFADALIHHGSGTQSLLLLFPGLLATVTSRASGHPVIVRVLQQARRSLPEGYELEIRWSPRWRQARRAVRWIWRRLHGDGAPWRPTRNTPRSVAEVAAAARRGALRMNRIHAVSAEEPAP